MIDAAERLVAERGLAALTLRDVQNEAGQANKSAAQYHFGSRDGLLTAVIESRMRPAALRRRELLDAIESTPGPPPLRTLIEALVLPLAERTIGLPGSLYARFLVQSIFDPAMRPIVNDHVQTASFRSLIRRIAAASALPDDVAELRTTNMTILCVVTFATWEEHAGSRHSADAIVADLIESCLGVLTAPVARTEPQAVADEVDALVDNPDHEAASS